MKTLVWTLFPILSLAATLPGQDRRGGRGGGFDPVRMAAPLLATAADTNRDGRIDAGEWKAFLKAVRSEKDREAVDLAALQSRFVAGALDMDRDGALTPEDLDALFAALDADEDGVLGEDELRPFARPRGMGRRGRGGGEGRRAGGGRQRGNETEGRRSRRDRGGAAGGRNRFVRSLGTELARRADTDRSGDVTREEWKKFVADLTSRAEEGKVRGVDAKALIAALQAPRPVDADAPQGGDEGRGRPRRRRGNVLAVLGRLLDTDRSGSLELADLEDVFLAVDRNGDGVLDREELQPRFGRGDRRPQGGDDRKGRRRDR